MWEEGTCWLLEKTACTTTLRFGYLFLQALMVRNGEQIIGVARSFLVLPGEEKVVILWVNTGCEPQREAEVSV